MDVNEGSTDNCGIDTLLVRRRFDLDPLSCDPVTPLFRMVALRGFQLL